MENQAYLWPKNHNIDTSTIIGVFRGETLQGPIKVYFIYDAS